MRATVIVALLLAALLLPGCGESGTAGPAAEEEQAAPLSNRPNLRPRAAMRRSLKRVAAHATR